MGILNQVDSLLGGNDTSDSPVIPADTPSPFARSLRSGATSLGGQFHAIGGQLAEGVGADELATNQRAASLAAQQQAAQEGEGLVHSYKDVHSLKDAWNYGQTLAGGALPVMGMGLAGGLAARFLPGGKGIAGSILGNAAGMAPSTVGQQFEAQQADPVQAAKPYLDRTLTGLGTGVAQAGAMAAVPGAFEGKLFGKTAQGTVAKSLGDAALHNVPGAVAGNAAAMAASSELGHQAASHLNPARDTSGDTQENIDEAIQGGIFGGVMSPMGIAGDMRGTKTPTQPGQGNILSRALGNGKDAATTVATSKEPVPINGAPDTVGSSAEVTATARAPVPLSAKVADVTEAFTGRPVPDVTGKTPDEAHTILDDHEKVKADQEAFKAKWKADRAARAAGAEPKPESSNEVPAHFDDVPMSKMATNAPDPVAADNAYTMGEFHRVAKAKGKVETWRAQDIADMLDNEPHTTLLTAYDKITDPAERKNFLKAADQVMNVAAQQKSTISSMTSLLKPEYKKTASQLTEIIPKLREFYNGDLGKGLDKFEQEHLASRVEALIDQHFTDREAVTELFQKERDAAGETHAPDAPNVTEAAKSEADLTQNDVDREGNNAAAADLPAGDVPDVKYYGKRPLKSDPENAQFVQEVFNGHLMERAKQENPNHDVSWISSKEYVKEHGLDPALAKEGYGLVQAKGSRSRDAFSYDDVKKMSLDAKRYSDSASRINVPVDGGKPVILDAVKIASHIQKKMGHAKVEDLDPLHEMKRNFTEGLAALSEHFGENVVPGDKVIVGWHGGKAVTYGDLKKLKAPERANTYEGSDKTTNDQHRRISELTKEIEAHQAEIERHKAVGWSDAQIEKAARAVAILDEYKGRERLNDVEEQQRDRANMWLDKIGRKAATKLGWEKLSADRKAEGIKSLEESIKRKSENAEFADHKEKGDELGGGGMREIAPTGEVHLAAKEHGSDLGERFAKSENTDANRMPNHAVAEAMRGWNKVTNTVNEVGKSLIKARIREFDRELGPDMIPKKEGELVPNPKEPARRVQLAILNDMFKHWDRLSADEQKTMLDISRYKTLESVAGTVEQLKKSFDRRMNALAKENALRTTMGEEKVFPKTEAAEQKNIRALAATPEGSAKLVARAAKSNDMNNLQLSVSRLDGQKHPNEHTMAAIHAINDRIGALLAENPYRQLNLNAAKEGLKVSTEEMANAQGTGTDQLTPEQKASIEKIIDTSLGKTAVLSFQNTTKFSGKYTADLGGLGKALIAVSNFVKDPDGVAYHESLHGLFGHMRKAGIHEVTDALDKVAQSPLVMAQLRKLLEHEPEAWKQVQTSREEAAAFMYQFWAKGDLKLGEQTNGIFHRLANAIKHVFGVWTSHERAEHIMKYFQSGEYAKNMGDRSAVYSALLKQGRNDSLHHLKESIKPVYDLAQRTLGIGSALIRDMQIAPYNRIVDLISKHSTGIGSDRGYIPTYTMKSRTIMNVLAEKLKPFSQEDVAAAWTQMHRVEKGSVDTLDHAEIKSILRGVVDEVYQNMKAAGVNIGHIKGYTPVQWDAAYIAKNQGAFLEMARRAIARDPSIYVGTPESLMYHLMRNEGNEIGLSDASPTTRPSDLFAKERIFSKFLAAEREPFVIKNPMEVISSYVYQGTRRAEWSRRFGADLYNAEGEKTGFGESALIDRWMKEAKDKHGATAEQEKTLLNYIAGVNGTLGAEMSPTARKWQSGLMVAQNIRLLGLGWFTGTIDPLGIKVRGGTWGDAWNTYKLGITQVARGLMKEPGENAHIKFAEDMGVIESAMLGNAVQSAYGINTLGHGMRKMNDWMFKYNLMEQQSKNMRAGAAVAGAKFIARHNDGKFNEHSARYMDELGLKPGDALIGKDGNLLATPDEIRDHYVAEGKYKNSVMTGVGEMTLDQAVEAQAAKMRMAINTFVDGAVVRPDASKKAIWMNDPYFAVVAHMKAYTYAFHDTILKRAWHEAEHGNYQPMSALAAYVPTMLAADMAKGLIQGAGSTPEYQKDWGPADYLAYETQRAGLLSTGQYMFDEAKGIRSHSGWLNAFGPTASSAEQIMGAVTGAGGAEQYASALLPTPASMWVGHGVGHNTSMIPQEQD